jgi:hypothetical protein
MYVYIHRLLNAVVALSKNCPFWVNTMIDLKSVNSTPYSMSSSRMCQLTSVPVLSDIAVTFLRSIIILTPNDSFWIVPLLHSVTYIYRLSQEECARLRENVLWVKIHQYNRKYLYPKLNSYGERILKVWQLLHTYWLPNSY